MTRPKPSLPKSEVYERLSRDRLNTPGAVRTARRPLAVKKRYTTSGLSPGMNITGFWRLYEIDRLIAAGRYPNCAYLAEHLEVHKRTVERDIERLRDQFMAPIEYDQIRKGYYYSDQFSLPAIKLQEGEAIALFLGQKLLMQCKGTPLEDALNRAMMKIRLLLPDEIEVDLERAVEAVSFHVDPMRGDEIEVAQTYQTLTEALENRKTVDIEYYSASRNEHTVREIDPYHLRLVEGSWYCIAYCHERAEVRIFALDRISSIKVTDKIFEVPEDFSIEEYLGDSLTLERGTPHKVVIEFDNTQVPYVKDKTWHTSQQIEELPDGGFRLTLTTGSLGEIMRWVMSLGSHAVIVQPEALRQRIVDELEKARNNYNVGRSDG